MQLPCDGWAAGSTGVTGKGCIVVNSCLCFLCAVGLTLPGKAHTMKAGCLCAVRVRIDSAILAARSASKPGRHTLSSTEMIETTPQSDGVSTAIEEPAGHEEESHEHSHATATLNPDCTREVEIEIPADEVTRNFRSVTKRYQKMARIPGFRSGKVPESLIRARFAEKIRQDVMEAVLPGHFRSAIAEAAAQAHLAAAGDRHRSRRG